MISAMEILLTGASGFVGSLLLPRLAAEGHAVRALSRHPAALRETLAGMPSGSTATTVLAGDALTGEGLGPALAGVEVAYYLIHSMERTAAGTSFVERERIAASNFAAAARAAGVRRIVYLGGLVPRAEQDSEGGSRRADPCSKTGSSRAGHHGGRGSSRADWLGRRGSSRAARPSRHLASRMEVERILMEAVPDSLALRSSIVIGAGSRSFRLLVRLVERMRVIALPAWQRYRTSPIDERDVTAMLAACAGSEISGEVLEVGGPDTLSYGEILQRLAEAMLIGRPAVGLRVNLTPLAGRVAAAIASEDPELVVPLMEGLGADLLPREDRAAERLQVHLHSFDSAVEHALAEWERTEPLAAR